MRKERWALPSFGKLVLAALVVVWFVGVSCTHAVVIYGDSADAGFTSTAAGDGAGTGVVLGADTGTTMRVGRLGSTTIGTFVFVFQLPSLGAGQSIGVASLTVQTINPNDAHNLGANIDLYGLGYRHTSVVVVGDYYVGSSDSTDAALLQDNWLASGAAYGAASRTTSPAGDIALVDYLNAQYANGATGGDYVFLRLNYDAFPDLSNSQGGRIEVATGNSTTSGYVPFMTYEIVPEPATLGLALAGLTMFVGVRRKLPTV